MSGHALGFTALLSAGSMLLYSIVAWIFAVRLLLLARKNWSIPEVSLALGYLLIAGLGYPMAAASIGAWQALGETLALTTLIFACVILRVGLAGIFLFTWQTFRPKSMWGKSFFLTGAALLAADGLNSIARLLVAPGYDALVAIAGSGGSITLSIMLSALAFGWPAAESLSYHFKLRRRRALGLADPVVANRFLLWGIACTSSVFISLVNAGTAFFGLNLLENRPAMMTSALLGVLNSVLLILAFLPPVPYLRFIRRRAAAEQT